MIDLNKYTDQQIVKMLLDLDVTKFMQVLVALGQITERINKRGATIGQNWSEEQIDKFLEMDTDDE